MRALGLLARREHAEREIKHKLLLRGYGREDVEDVIAGLKAEGLQDDARYTAAYIHARISKGYGPVRIAQELRQRGIAGDLVELSMAAADIDWRERLEAARSKRFGERLPADDKEQARQARFLHYRGFTTEQISHAFR